MLAYMLNRHWWLPVSAYWTVQLLIGSGSPQSSHGVLMGDLKLEPVASFALALQLSTTLCPDLRGHSLPLVLPSVHSVVVPKGQQYP